MRIDALDLASAVDAVLQGRPGGAVHLCNAYTLSLASRDAAFATVLNRGALNLADGTPVVWIGRRLGFGHLDRRVYGPELMAACLDRGRATGVRHYLFGSTSETLHALRTQIEHRWPGAEMVGYEAPPFRAQNDDEVAVSSRTMALARADVVWVGLGTPKQDEMVDRLARSGSATYVAVGAAFDFIAGTKRQAPRWMREHGLEWLFRLLIEPRRLWRRYFIGNTRFVWSNLRRRPRRYGRGPE